MNQNDFFTKWSALHGNAEIKGIVKAWLKISFASAKFLSRLRLTPNLITLLGIVFAVAMAVNPLSLWAIPLLVLSLYADGIDGSVAIYQNRESQFGAVLDSFADRISEALWFYVAYRIGAPAWIVLLTSVVGIFIVPVKAIAIAMARCINQHKPSFVPGVFNHRIVIWRADINCWIFNWHLTAEDIFKLFIVIFGKQDIVMR